MNALRRWWHNRQQSHAAIAARMDRIETNLNQIAHQLHVHVLATDTRLSVYDVLIPKTLADLNATLHELSATQMRLVDLMERRESTPKAEATRKVPIHTERSA